MGQDSSDDGSEELLLRASSGDQAALDTLLARHIGGLRAFIRLRAGPAVRARESVSDLVQSVCREILEHADRFQHGGDVGFRHWLCTTALRKIANRQRYYRAARRDVRRERPIGQEISAEADAQLLACYATFCSPSRSAVAREELSRVEKAFDRLPEHYREVIVLSKIVGLSRAEVAREMNRTEDAVASLLYRALIELAQIADRP